MWTKTTFLTLSLSLALFGLSNGFSPGCLIPKGTNQLTRALLLQQCISEHQAQDNDTVCYPGLGCFSMADPWVSLLRPFPNPWSPDEINASVTLYTRNANDGSNMTLWPDIIVEENDFNANRSRSVFLTHGFGSKGSIEWLHQLKDAFLDSVDANVFILDWGKGATSTNYLQVAHNTRIVASELARFIKYLNKNEGLKTADIHLAGHSLGAHIMSYCAKQLAAELKSKVGRLTAMDPAQPGFEVVSDVVRLSKEDATNVDVIHTDAKPFLPFVGFGMIETFGHVDFYMNGGAAQPGCPFVATPKLTSISDLASYPVEVVAEWVACSHGRAHDYFIYSLKENCSFWGRKMSSAENIITVSTLGKVSLAEPLVEALSDCTPDTCNKLGLETFDLKARGAFVANTGSISPYCESGSEERLGKVVTEGLFGAAKDKLTPFLG